MMEEDARRLREDLQVLAGSQQGLGGLNSGMSLSCGGASTVCWLTFFIRSASAICCDQISRFTDAMARSSAR